LQHEGYHHRNDLIVNLVSRLRLAGGQQLVAAIKTAWVVGYRDDQLHAELTRIAGLQGEPHKDQDAEGYALAVLATMSYPDPDAIAGALRSRLARIGRLTEPDLWTAMHVATLDMIPALQQAAAASDSLGAEHALLELASRNPDAAHNVWEVFKYLDDERRFLLASNAANRINLEEVGEYLLAEALTAFQQLEHRNVLPPRTPFSMQTCQTDWRVSRANESLSLRTTELLRSPAVKPTGSEGFQTIESLNREAAWNVILRLGLSEARRWLPESMAYTANFTILEVAEIASFLQVTEAVEPLARIVKDETLRVGLGVGCLKSLGILGTQKAFQALLDSQVRIQQGGERLLPRALVQAMVSVCMTQNTCEPVWKILSDPAARTEMREACAYAVEDLSKFVNSPVPRADDIVSLLSNEGKALPGYDQLVFALSRFPDDRTALEFLRNLGRSKYESPKLTQALAVTGLLNEFPERIEKLGFNRVSEGWILEKPLDGRRRLVSSSGRSDFEPAVQQILSGDSRFPGIGS
jgi:hypothetical protein